MKKKCFCTLCVLLAALIAGCARQAAQAPSWTADAAPDYVTQWPTNRFTADLPQPETGEMDYIVDYSAGGRYEIVMKGMSRASVDAYISQLRSAGFADEAAGVGEASMGQLMRRGNVVLSIAASGEGMVMLITIE